MILVTGSTGHLGTATIEHLLKNTDASNIVAFARDENKAKHLKEKGIEVRFGDFEDTTSLNYAMRGIEKVLLISTIDHHRYQQHQNVVDAAKKAGVRHIAYTGVTLKDVNSSAVKPLMSSHFQTEDYIKSSEMNYTFLRNSLYAEVIPMYVGKDVFKKGIYLPASDGKVPFALRREMGEVAANVLLQNSHKNKTYHITGRELYSFQNIADQLSILSGKTIGYKDVDQTTFSNTLLERGLPQINVEIVSGFSADIKNKQYELIYSDMEELLGRKPASLKDSLKEIYQL